jgi:hypothetical protein
MDDALGPRRGLRDDHVLGIERDQLVYLRAAGLV